MKHSVTTISVRMFIYMLMLHIILLYYGKPAVIILSFWIFFKFFLSRALVVVCTGFKLERDRASNLPDFFCFFIFKYID